MNKHTPGPWTVYDDSNDGKTNRIEIVAIGKTVARIYHSVPSEDLPNALLIASAPDLLTALENLLFAATERDKKNRIRQFDDFVDQATSVIAKATGKHNTGAYFPPAPAVVDWIPCSERLPLSSGEYLVWVSEPNYNFGHPSVRVCVFEREYYGHEVNKFKGKGTVTHWMPLPTPPNGGV